MSFFFIDDPDALKPKLMRGLKKVLQKTVKSKNSNKATEQNQKSDLKNEEPSAKIPERKSITKNEKPNLSEIKVHSYILFNIFTKKSLHFQEFHTISCFTIVIFSSLMNYV